MSAPVMVAPAVVGKSSVKTDLPPPYLWDLRHTNFENAGGAVGQGMLIGLSDIYCLQLLRFGDFGLDGLAGLISTLFRGMDTCSLALQLLF